MALFICKTTTLRCALLLTIMLALIPHSLTASEPEINRKLLVEQHNPKLTLIDPRSPLTLGNGKFAFTADVTGFQSFANMYYKKGTPLETKARWAWHTRANPKGFTLKDASQRYDAYGVKVDFETNMDEEAGQWLRKNPHDLPLARLALSLDGKAIQPEQLSHISQSLDIWQGQLQSQYQLKSNKVSVTSAVHADRDLLAAQINSSLVASGSLGLHISLPRGYKLDKKNTPDIDWESSSEHKTAIIKEDSNSAIFQRNIDNHQHRVILHWSGSATLIKSSEHQYQLQLLKSKNRVLDLSIEFVASSSQPTNPVTYSETIASAKTAWAGYWQSGAAISLAGSKDPRAQELERRIVLSQYLMATQSKGKVPTQETGLTSSSWYGKHHTEMMWWHTAHWVYWNRPEQAEHVLDWYIERIESAQKVAKNRGLAGARWAKMVGPEGRESPGGNPLIIWNQPQPIHVAELLYQQKKDTKVLARYKHLVEETAKALSAMLVWEHDTQRYSLLPPIWIAQEIYPATQSKNPSFELSYWRYGLETAQKWRERLGLKPNTLWDRQIKQLANLPQKNGKYVAIESIPDTFDNIASRKDHPTMLAPLGLLQDPRVDRKVMQQTLDAVLKTWDWQEKIWGWDYPMIAMTALQLGHTDLAFELLLKDAPHNEYLINGHCPQQGAALPVYLPANGALLSAMAMIVKKWPEQPAANWNIHSEGFAAQQPVSTINQISTPYGQFPTKR